MIRRDVNNGFTLIEMLVAILMIAILYTLVFGALDSATDAKEETGAAGERLADLQRAFIWMEQDINLIVDRPVRNAFGSSEQAIIYNNQEEGRVLALSRNGWPNPIRMNRSDIVRVAYELIPDDKANAKLEAGEADLYNLYRVYWRDADRADEEPTRKRRVAQGVRSFKVRFMDGDKQWQKEWPPLSIDPSSILLPPRAVEVELDLQAWGKIRRVFRVVGGHGA